MYSICVSGHLDSGHYLRGYQGKCATPHGHRFTYQVTLSGENLNKLGMLIDFVSIKELMKKSIEDLLDHKMLNEIPPFDKVNPTAENLAYFIYGIVYKELKIKLTKVRVYESPDCYSEYWE